MMAVIEMVGCGVSRRWFLALWAVLAESWPIWAMAAAWVIYALVVVRW